MITLGSIVSDDICGFQGVATARTEYLNGCVRVEVQSKELKEDGSILDAVWIDENQLTQLTGLAPSEEKELHHMRKAYSTLEDREVTGGPERSIAPSRDP